jgi:hypothetical protein
MNRTQRWLAAIATLLALGFTLGLEFREELLYAGCLALKPTGIWDNHGPRHVIYPDGTVR